MIDTQVKTKQVTNTKLVVATFAAFMAGGLAFAAAPAQQAAAPKCGVNSAAIVTTAKGCAPGQYPGIDFTCQDGSKVQHRPGVCTSAAELNNFAKNACANKCSRAPAALAGTLSLDIMGQRDPLYILTNATNTPIGTNLQIRTGEKPIQLASIGLALNEYNDLHNVASSINALKLYERRENGEYVLIAVKLFDEFVRLQPSVSVALPEPLVIPAQTTLNWIITLDVKGLPEAKPGASFNINLDTSPAAHRAIDNVTGERARLNFGNGISTPLTLVPGNLDILPEDVRQNLFAGRQHIPGFIIQQRSNEAGQDITARLKTVKITMQTDGMTQDNIQNLELCTLEEFCIPLQMLPGQIPGQYVLANSGSDNTSIDLSIFDEESANTLASGERVTYYVRATFNSAGEENSFVQLLLSDVNTTGITYDFDFLEEEPFHEFVASGLKTMQSRGLPGNTIRANPLLRQN